MRWGNEARGNPTPVVTPGGATIITRSQLEGRILNNLTERGVAWAYEASQFRYTVEHRYTPDVLLITEAGHEIHLEIKGLFTPADRSKMLSVREQHKGIDLRLVFDRAERRISPTSRTTYGGWADKKGFKFAEGRVPETWVKELGGDHA